MCDQAAAESAQIHGAIGNNKDGKIKPSDAIFISLFSSRQLVRVRFVKYADGALSFSNKCLASLV